MSLDNDDLILLLLVPDVVNLLGASPLHYREPEGKD